MPVVNPVKRLMVAVAALSVVLAACTADQATPAPTGEQPAPGDGEAQLRWYCCLGTGEAPEQIAARVGYAGSGALKKELTEALNSMLAPIRERRARLAQDPAIVRDTLRKGIAEANRIAAAPLREVRIAMNMGYSIDL